MLRNVINYDISRRNIGYETPVRAIGIGAEYSIGRLNISAAVESDFREVRMSSGINVEIMKWMKIMGGVRDGIGYYGEEGIEGISRAIMNTGIKVETERLHTEYMLGYQGRLGIKHTISAGIRY